MSDGYTPTTEDVRDAYREQSDGCDFPTREDWNAYVACNGGEGEFDRWLVEHDRQVAADERVKIAVRLRDNAVLIESYAGPGQVVRLVALLVALSDPEQPTDALSTALQGVQEGSKA